MLRLIRSSLTLAAFAFFVYAATNIPLGQRTLWGHVKAIASTDEAQELVDGVREKASDVMEGQPCLPDDECEKGVKNPSTPRAAIDPEDELGAPPEKRVLSVSARATQESP